MRTPAASSTPEQGTSSPTLLPREDWNEIGASSSVGALRAAAMHAWPPAFPLSSSASPVTVPFPPEENSAASRGLEMLPCDQILCSFKTNGMGSVF